VSADRRSQPSKWLPLVYRATLLWLVTTSWSVPLEVFAADPQTDVVDANASPLDLDVASDLAAERRAAEVPERPSQFHKTDRSTRGLLPSVDCGIQDTQDPLYPVIQALATVRVAGFEFADCSQKRNALQGRSLEITLRGHDHDLLLLKFQGLAEEGYALELAPIGNDELRLIARVALAGGYVEYVRINHLQVGGSMLADDVNRLSRVLDIHDRNFFPSILGARARELGYHVEFIPEAEGAVVAQLAPGRSIRRIRVRGHLPLPEREIRRTLSVDAQPGALARGRCVDIKTLRRSVEPPPLCAPRDVACRTWELGELGRLEEYLFNSAYFRGHATLSLVCGRKYDEADLYVFLDKGKSYRVDRRNVVITGAPSADQRWIRQQFIPRSLGLFPARVTRDFIDRAIESVETAYTEPNSGLGNFWQSGGANTGYPEVRVSTSYEDISRTQLPERQKIPLTIVVDLGDGVRSRYLVDRAHRTEDPVTASQPEADRPSLAARKQHSQSVPRFDDERLDEQLQLFPRREPSSDAAAAREAGNIRAYYQSKGHLLARVEGEHHDFGSFKKLKFTIHEGPRINIASILLVPPIGIPPAVTEAVNGLWHDGRKLRKRGTFSERKAREDIGTVLAAYNDIGYLCATATITVAFWKEGLGVTGERAVLDLSHLIGGSGTPRWTRQFDSRGLFAIEEQASSRLYVRIDVTPGPRIVTAPDETVLYLDDPIPIDRSTANIPQRESGRWGPRRMLHGSPLRRGKSDKAGGIALSQEVSRATRRSVIDRYRDSGYPIADVELSWRYASPQGPVIVPDLTTLTSERISICREHKADAVVPVETIVNVYEGKRGHFGDTLFRGNFKTRESVLRRELDFHRGDAYSARVVTRAIRKIERLGVATRVRIQDYAVGCEFDDEQQCKVHELVTIDESKDISIDLEVGFGAATLNPFFVWGAPKFPNLFGSAWDLNTEARYGFDLSNALARSDFCDRQTCYERSAQASLLRRHVLGSLTNIDVTGRYQLRATPARGEISSAVFSPRLSWELSDNFTLYTGYLFQKANISRDIVKPLGIDNAPWTHRPAAVVSDNTGLVEIGFGWTQVDNAFNPYEGFISTFDIKLASPYLGGNDWWARIDLGWQHFIPIPRTSERLGLRYSLRYGQLFPFAGPRAHTVTVPDVWRYYGGGTANLGIRGILPETMLVDIEEVPQAFGGVLFRPRAQGGHVRALGTLALQIVSLKRFLGGKLAHSIFYDFGVLTQFWRNARLNRDFRHSAGINVIKWDIRIVTMAVGYAVLIPNRHNVGRTDDTNGRLVFNVGVTF